VLFARLQIVDVMMVEYERFGQLDEAVVTGQAPISNWKRLGRLWKSGRPPLATMSSEVARHFAASAGGDRFEHI
jgi:hypothetical protein